MGGMRGASLHRHATGSLPQVRDGPDPRLGAAELSSMDFQLLGPLRVVVDGVDVPIPTRRQRALLVLLLMNVGRAVPAERLIDQLWDGAPPSQAAVTLRSYVSNVRQALGGPEGLGSFLVTRGQGYALEVPEASIDGVRLGRLAEQGRELLRQGRPKDALDAFQGAVRTWRGDPLADVAEHEVARSSVAALTEAYLGAVEGRFEALLALGRHADALPDLEAFAADHPLREEPVALLMLGLHRAGRAPEALEVHRTFRALLQQELGIDPSRGLEELHRQILERDPALALPPGPPVSPPQPHGDGTRTGSGPPVRGVGGSARPATRQAMVGRGRELAALSARLDELGTSGTGCLVLISGEAGIGKSTIIEALGDEARYRGFRVHSGRSSPATGAPAFWPWVQVLDSIAAELDDASLARAVAGAARPVAQLSPTIAERTGHALPLLGDSPQALRFSLYEAVSAFIRQASPPGGTVVALDDIHWADGPSLELLSYLASSVASRPLMLVATYRDLPADRSEVLDATLATVSREDVSYELAVSGLKASEVAELIQPLVESVGVLGDRERLAGLLHQRTGGNPFFVRQLTRLMLDGEAGEADPLSVPAPPGVRHVIARRLAALADPAQRLLAAAAIVGRDFDLRTAAAATGMEIEAALDAIDEATRHGLVERHDEPGADRRFVHALVQEVLLDLLPAGRAARLHAAVAARLQDAPTANPDELARHLWAARDIVGIAAVPALVAAAERAAAVFAVEQAEVHLRRALELVRMQPDPDRSAESGLLLKLFRLIVSARGWGDGEGRALIDRAIELAEAGAYSDATAPLWCSMFQSLTERNDPAGFHLADTLLAAVAEADRATPDVEPESDRRPPRIGPVSRAVAHLASFFRALDDGNRASARNHLLEAHRQIEAAAPEDLAAFEEPLQVIALIVEGNWAAMNGDEDGHRSVSNAMIALADADGRPFSRAVARATAAASGLYGAEPGFVGELARDAIDVSRRFGFTWVTQLAECLRAWADAHTRGVEPGSLVLAEEALAAMLKQGRFGAASLYQMLRADLLALSGRTREARDGYVRVREDPGPYRGLAVDLVDERLRRLSAG